MLLTVLKLYESNVRWLCWSPHWVFNLHLLLRLQDVDPWTVPGLIALPDYVNGRTMTILAYIGTATLAIALLLFFIVRSVFRLVVGGATAVADKAQRAKDRLRKLE